MDPTPVLVAIITTLGTIVVAYLAARSGTLGGRLSRVEEAAKWKERYETERAKVDEWRDRFERERERAETETAARREAERRADYAERDADACTRRLDNLYSELRASGRLVDRRSVPREEGGSG